MRLEITGNVEPWAMENTIEDSLELWFEKLLADNQEMAEVFAKVEGIKFTSIALDMCFKLEGNDEWQVITTDNHAEIPELLTVKVATDEHGHIITDSVTDNDGDSDYSEFEAIIAAGATGEHKPVASMYEAGELELQEDYDFGNIEIDVLIDPECQVVVQALEFNFQYDVTLIAEAVFPADQLNSIKQHYLELAEATEG